MALFHPGHIICIQCSRCSRRDQHGNAGNKFRRKSIDQGVHGRGLVGDVVPLDPVDLGDLAAGGAARRLGARDVIWVLEIDDLGLDSIDRRVLATMVDQFDGGPVGPS